MSTKPKRCPSCNRLIKRSNPANSRYWLLLHLISDKLKPKNQEYSAEVWHAYFKARYIGADDIKMPNGKVIVMPKSSADLDTAEFADFMTQVEIFANEHDVWMDDVVTQ